MTIIRYFYVISRQFPRRETNVRSIRSNQSFEIELKGERTFLTAGEKSVPRRSVHTTKSDWLTDASRQKCPSNTYRKKRKRERERTQKRNVEEISSKHIWLRQRSKRVAVNDVAKSGTFGIHLLLSQWNAIKCLIKFRNLSDSFLALLLRARKRWTRPLSQLLNFHLTRLGSSVALCAFLSLSLSSFDLYFGFIRSVLNAAVRCSSCDNAERT